jgi:hypothetical protein
MAELHSARVLLQLRARARVVTTLGLGREAADAGLAIYGGYDVGSTPNPERIGGRAVISVVEESGSMQTQGRRRLIGWPRMPVTQGAGSGCQ